MPDPAPSAAFAGCRPARRVAPRRWSVCWKSRYHQLTATRQAGAATVVGVVAQRDLGVPRAHRGRRRSADAARPHAVGAVPPGLSRPWPVRHRRIPGLDRRRAADRARLGTGPVEPWASAYSRSQPARSSSGVSPNTARCVVVAGRILRGHRGHRVHAELGVDAPISPRRPVARRGPWGDHRRDRHPAACHAQHHRIRPHHLRWCPGS